MVVKLNKISLLEFAFLMGVSTYYYLPYTSNVIPFMLMIAICTSYLLFSCIKQTKYSHRIIMLLLGIIFIALLYFLLTETKTISENVSNYNLKRFLSKINQLFFTFSPAFLSYRIIKFGSRKQRALLLVFSLCLFSYVFYNTYTALIINPFLARNWELFDDAIKGNIGTYTFVYSIPVIIVSLTSVVLHSNRIMVSILSITLIIICFSFLLLAQYTLAILISIVGTFILIFKKLNQKNRILLTLICLIIIPLIPYILSSIIPLISSIDITIRLGEILSFIQGDGIGYYLMGRLNLYWKSILAFFSSPLIGNRILDFDGHATFLTILSDVGLIGAIPFFSLLFIAGKQTNELLGVNELYFKPVFMCLLIMGFTNPIHAAYTLSYTTWFITPLFFSLFDNKIIV